MSPFGRSPLPAKWVTSFIDGPLLGNAPLVGNAPLLRNPSCPKEARLVVLKDDWRKACVTTHNIIIFRAISIIILC